MPPSYPKTPIQIQIKIVYQGNEGGILSPIRTSAVTTLRAMLEDYLIRLGTNTAHLMGVIVHLMTQAKVVVDFRDRRERLELVDPRDMIDSNQAISLFEDFLAEEKKSRGMIPDSGSTQRIVIQLPRK